MMTNETMGDAEGVSSDTNEGEEKTSVFLPKSALMGKDVKAGDKLTMTVQDVDPESGDVEATCDYSEPSSDGSKGYEKAFDEAMPA